MRRATLPVLKIDKRHKGAPSRAPVGASEYDRALNWDTLGVHPEIFSRTLFSSGLSLIFD